MTSAQFRSAFVFGVAAVLGAVMAVVGLSIAKDGGTERASAGPSKTKSVLPAHRTLGAFSDPGLPSAQLPTSVIARLNALAGGAASVDPELRPGAFLVERAQLLLADVGRSQADLYGVPTAKGQVCYVLTGGPSGCEARFDQYPIGFTRFDGDGLGIGEPMAVVGIAPDNIAQIDVRVGSVFEAATLRKNGFFFEGRTATATPNAIRVTFGNGAVETIELAPLPAS